MPKDSFFEEDEELDEKPSPEKPAEGAEKPVAPAKEKTPEKGEEKPSDDGIDWKAKYEEAEAAKKNDRYYDELLRFDDTLEGDTLEALEGGKEYRKLREMGLSPRAAYAAMTADKEDDVPAKSEGASAKSHVSATDFRRATPSARMDRSTRQIVEEMFGDSLTREEMEALYKKVK